MWTLSVAGREFLIPSLAHRFIAEMVDFFILFLIKATIILSFMHFSGIKDIPKLAMHYIIEEIDEDTSMEDLQKMMIVALIYRLLVCFYEIICIWGAGGATPGKFLLGLRVVTCETSVLIAPSRVLVIPSSNVSMTTSTIRALIKNFSIASFFPAFITLLFFQHNRTAYDIVAGTIVVRRNGVRWYQKMAFPDWFWTSPPSPSEYLPQNWIWGVCWNLLPWLNGNWFRS